MRIAEIFRSLQGEGFLTGTPTVFVRTSGCNLRCWFCDTAYTSWEPEGDDLAIEEILRLVDALLADNHWSVPAVAVKRRRTTHRPLRSRKDRARQQATDLAMLDDEMCRHAVLTGGEPMLYAELVPLAEKLRDRDLHITVETAGTLYLPLQCDLMSISPKLHSSTPPPDRDLAWHHRHKRSRHQPDVIHRLVYEYPYQIKFVIDTLDDCEQVEQWLEEFPEIARSRVLLMPQGTDAAELQRRARWLEPYCHENEVQFCPRKHIEWFGHKRGT